VTATAVIVSTGAAVVIVVLAFLVLWFARR